ncbi:hypothetical protein BURKHO8Y_20175 [Burkholderia sp. 8Y]|nr:hypothetical protein BURKHO8Y_20175 [Burkholderia sp. 8Y]
MDARRILPQYDASLIAVNLSKAVSGDRMKAIFDRNALLELQWLRSYGSALLLH